MSKILQLPSNSNPYLSARQQYSSCIGGHIARENQWRLLAFLSGLVAILAVSGLIYVASQPKLVPYVVQVDKLGTAVAVKRADKAGRPDENVIRAQLARWMHNVRSVYADAAAERYMIQEAYSMIGSAGVGSLDAYFQTNDPFKRAKEMTVTVDIQSVLPISNDTWRVEWMENQYKDGKLLSSLPYQAMVSTIINPPTDEKTLLSNPMGIFINDFRWSQRL